LAVAATDLPGGEGVVLNQDDEREIAMIECEEQRPVTRGRKLKHDFDPPEEYISQRRQDLEEWDGICGCSFGPNSKPGGPWSPEGELQYLLWDHGIWCDVELFRKKDESGSYISARLSGAPKERVLARPIVQRWINDYADKKATKEKQL
jgi:hypothetical protein